jgi:hypothetical protein
MEFILKLRVYRRTGHYLSLLAALLLALASLNLAALRAAPAGQAEGSLIAAFVTKQEILLCSDGRAVSSADGAIVREDLPKVHRLTSRIGMLTAGRTLPGLIARFKSGASAGESQPLVGLVGAMRDALQAEWQDVVASSNGGTTGRAFAFVTGFDESGTPRVFYMDTYGARNLRVTEMSMLAGGRELEVVAIASGDDGSMDASAAIVRHIDAIHRRQPGLARQALLVAAFKAAQDELSARDPRIGGRTFAAAIGAAGGYKTVDTGR